jgi:hypothetical protein
MKKSAHRVPGMREQAIVGYICTQITLQKSCSCVIVVHTQAVMSFSKPLCEKWGRKNAVAEFLNTAEILLRRDFSSFYANKIYSQYFCFQSMATHFSVKFHLSVL